MGLIPPIRQCPLLYVCMLAVYLPSGAYTHTTKDIVGLVESNPRWELSEDFRLVYFPVPSQFLPKDEFLLKVGINFSALESVVAGGKWEALLDPVPEICGKKLGEMTREDFAAKWWSYEDNIGPLSGRLPKIL